MKTSQKAITFKNSKQLSYKMCEWKCIFEFVRDVRSYEKFFNALLNGGDLCLQTRSFVNCH